MSSTPRQVDRGVVVFGAGGQVGRAVVTEARRRGLAVTAAVRDPERHRDLAGEGVGLVRCDVTDPAAVAATAHGHTAAVSTVYTPDVPSADFYGATADALVAGLDTARVRRLVHVGVATTLETAPGTAVHDDPAFPEAYRAFSLGHALALDRLRESDAALDWVVVTPPLDLDRAAPGTGRYRTGGPQVLGERIAQADLAVAVVDELTAPAHHREQIAVAE
ncbi:NAD(P)H-binding protein [Kitasatospora sp. RG8]|uniref:NAD(P)-dependent oxidoreductase n=1 Tax=Kitasatospora sp. RG8 TaxID=2820815 RepID=UPI001ADEC307|nr:NAD(P)H-binding protein [Kitasatospora sp. RG8]MBP0454357.1 NAD(P)H-binding protein [Kitasatospora sp. RG8]